MVDDACVARDAMNNIDRGHHGFNGQTCIHRTFMGFGAYSSVKEYLKIFQSLYDGGVCFRVFAE
ncbi:hypothetical protein SDC9_87932 [bioreactor metagenome]|uniref:Uncharacterized protein n=1 Tax=bioreactor metagenome TaxID=1076179 RepID=A0A644ZK76_9ZZZZ